jgi:DNA replication and repair protein RecF
LYVSTLQLTDFRAYESAELSFTPGITVITGANAQGKTTLLEAVTWAARGASFRGVPDAALVKSSKERAILRAEVIDDSRSQWIEAELAAVGRNRVLVNRRPVTTRREQRETLQVSVFAPDDLQLVKGGPAGRRDYLDDLLVTVWPRYETTRADYERVLRQRNALLRAGLRGPDAVSTLDVFDAQLARAGGELVWGRLQLLTRLEPELLAAHRELTGEDGPAVEGLYAAEWCPDDPGSREDAEQRLHGALAAGRRAETERGVTLSGPHRDEWRIRIGGLDSRSHASQGEQRTLALALRLAGHRLCTRVTGRNPVLLLDDVFSELDHQRAAALLERLDAEQTLITTAASLPPGIRTDCELVVAAGRVQAAA